MYKNKPARCCCPMDCGVSAKANTVPAGSACSGVCKGFDLSELVTEYTLAEIMFPIQIYSVGFCPDEAFQAGTLFPELVRPYK